MTDHTISDPVREALAELIEQAAGMRGGDHRFSWRSLNACILKAKSALSQPQAASRDFEDLIASIDNASGCAVLHTIDGDIKVIVPNGKMRVERLGDECEKCKGEDLFFAQRIVRALALPAQQPQAEAGEREKLKEELRFSASYADAFGAEFQVVPFDTASRLLDEAFALSTPPAQQQAAGVMIGERQHREGVGYPSMDAAIAARAGREAPAQQQEQPALTDDQERNAFYAMFEEAAQKTGHKPTAFDVWLMARGLMGTDGRRVQQPATSTEQEPAAAFTWTGDGDIDTALILLDRIDATEDQARLDQLEEIIKRLAVRMAAHPPAEGTEQRQPSSLGATVAMTREVRMAVMLAYGHLWHVNNEPAAPIPMYSPEKAAYEARKQLRDLLTKQERGEAINQVGVLIGRYTQRREQ